MGHPQISVVLVAWNRRADLERAIRSLRAQDHPRTELVVVDNGSTDGTGEMLRSGSLGPMTLCSAPRNLGASVARNVGIGVATGELTAFMDSDAELPDPDALSRLADALAADARLAAVAPAIYSDTARSRVWLLGGYFLRGCYHDHARSTRETADPDVLSTCFSLWRTEALRQSGGFDPAYPFCFEDCDLSVRVRAAGWRLGVCPDVSAIHHCSADGRVREYPSFAHRLYIERSANRHMIQRMGVARYLREVAWLLGRGGRDLRRGIYAGYPLDAWRKARLFLGVPVSTLARYPAIRAAAGGDWITGAAESAGVTVERVGA